MRRTGAGVRSALTESWLQSISEGALQCTGTGRSPPTLHALHPRARRRVCSPSEPPSRRSVSDLSTPAEVGDVRSLHYFFLHIDSSSPRHTRPGRVNPSSSSLHRVKGGITRDLCARSVVPLSRRRGLLPLRRGKYWLSLSFETLGRGRLTIFFLVFD